MGESPQTHHLTHLQSQFPFFFNPNNKHTQPQETTTPPRYPQNSQRDGQGAARPGRWGSGQREEEKLVRCSLCFSSQQALGRGPPAPPAAVAATKPEAMAGTEWAGWGSLGGGRNKIQNHGSHHAVSTVGTRRGRGVDTTPTCPGQRGEWCPPGIGRWDSCSSRNWGKGLPGRKLAQTGAQWMRSAMPLHPARPYRTLCIY